LAARGARYLSSAIADAILQRGGHRRLLCNVAFGHGGGGIDRGTVLRSFRFLVMLERPRRICAMMPVKQPPRRFS
jgi:hypothetical protein